MRSSVGILLAAAAIACGGQTQNRVAQNTVMVDVQRVSNGADVTAQMASKAWNGKKGNATLAVDSGAGAVSKSEVTFHVRDVLFHAHIPQAAIPRDDSTLSGTLTYPPEGSRGSSPGTYAIALAAAPKGSLPVATSPTTPPGGVNGTPGQAGIAPTPPPKPEMRPSSPPRDDDREQSSWFEDFFQGKPTAWINQALLVLFVGLAIWTAISVNRLRQSKTRSTPAVAERQLQDLSERQMRLTTVIPRPRLELDVDEARKEARRAVSASENVRHDLQTLRERIDLLAPMETAIRSVRVDLDSIEDTLNALRQKEQPSVPPLLNTNMPYEAAALVAVVNDWLARGSRDRGQILILAQRVNLDARLVAHKDLSQVFKDLTTFEYLFELSDDGGWLWTRVPGTDEFWAVPTDATLFSMGSAPEFLDRLFDGAKGIRTNPSFIAIYRPCRLRLIAGKPGCYSMVERGLVRAAGAPAPAEPDPLGFEYFQRPASAYRISSSVSPGLGPLLGDWIREVNQQLQEQTDELRGLRENIRSLDRVQPGVHDEQLRQLRSDLETRIQQHSRQIETLEKLAKSASGPGQPRSEGFVDRLREGVEIAEPVTPTAGAGKPRSVPSRMQIELRMPESWRKALHAAAEASSSQQNMAELPHPELYVNRIRNLARELARIAGRAPVAVVHLKKHPVESEFETHEVTDEVRDGGARCPTCDDVHSWQLAVRIGAGDAPQLFLLLPLGTLVKGNYASGYSALIEESLPSVFTITDIAVPATLLQAGDSSRSYAVAKKMSISFSNAG